MLQQTPIFHPLHFMIVRREGTKWIFSGGGRVILNPRNVPVLLSVEDRLHRFKLTPSQAMIELFRINGGKPGYYLINMRNKQYYYCGTELSDVRLKLIDLGVLIQERD